MLPDAAMTDDAICAASPSQELDANEATTVKLNVRRTMRKKLRSSGWVTAPPKKRTSPYACEQRAGVVSYPLAGPSPNKATAHHNDDREVLKDGL